jgi:hypothetical protein
MANLDEPDPGPGAASNGMADHAPVSGADQRVRELERENAKLRGELADAEARMQALWRTLRTVAPEYAVTEAEMREVVENPVPLRDALAEAERLLRM